MFIPGRKKRISTTWLGYFLSFLTWHQHVSECSSATWPARINSEIAEKWLQWFVASDYHLGDGLFSVHINHDGTIASSVNHDFGSVPVRSRLSDWAFDLHVRLLNGEAECQYRREHQPTNATALFPQKQGKFYRA